MAAATYRSPIMSSLIATTSLLSSTTSDSSVATRSIGVAGKADGEENEATVETMGEEFVAALGATTLAECDVLAARAPVGRRGDWWRCAGEVRAGERLDSFGDARKEADPLGVDREADLEATVRTEDGDAPSAVRTTLVDLDLPITVLGTSASTAAAAVA